MNTNIWAMFQILEHKAQPKYQHWAYLTLFTIVFVSITWLKFAYFKDNEK